MSAGVLHLAAATGFTTRRRVVTTAAWQLPAVLLGLGAVALALRPTDIVVNAYWFTFYGAFVWVVFAATMSGSESLGPPVAAARRLSRRRTLARDNLVKAVALGTVAAAYVAGVLTRGESLVAAATAAAIVGLVASSALAVHAAMVALPADRVRARQPMHALWRSGRTGVATGLIVLLAVTAAATLLAAIVVIAGFAVYGVGDDPLTWVIPGVVGIVQAGVVLASTVWAPIAVVSALDGGIGAVTEHFAARVIAARRGWLPLALVTLLAEAAREGIMYPVGPGWRFRHRTLATQLAAVHHAVGDIPEQTSNVGG